MNETISARVLVLGGGIAGLSAARRLSAKGVRVTLLEARSRLGGRIDTWHLDGSNNVDLGASFIHGTAGNPIGQYAGRSGFRAADPKDDEMRYVVDRSGGVQLDPETSNRVNFFSFDTTFSRLQRAVQQGNQSPHEEESIWSGLIQNDKYPDVWRGIEQQERNHVLSVSSMWSGWTGARLSQVSLKWWGFEHAFPGSDSVVVPGYYKLIDWNEQRIRANGGSIHLDNEVVTVEQQPDGSVQVQTKNPVTGKTQSYDGTHVVCALPLGVMQKRLPTFTPALPGRRTAALARLGMGLLNKIVLSYDRAWWRAPDARDSWIFLLPSDFSTKVHDLTSLDEVPETEEHARAIIETAGFALLDYKPITGHPVLQAFVAPPAAQALEMVPSDWAAETLHRRLVLSLLPSSEQSSVPAPIQTRVTAWNKDPYSLGSYSYIPNSNHATPLDLAEASKPLWDGKLGFCGEHTHPDYYASVHGALLEGEREADRIINQLIADGESIDPRDRV